MAGGRPKGSDEYKPEYDAQAAKLCALGATDIEIADFFGVDVRTFYRWKASHESFCQTIKNAKEVSDERVERSLFERANGYERDEVDIRVVNGEIVQTTIRKFYPPDPTAMIFWLKNRRPAQWRDKQELKVENDANPVSELVSGIVRGLQNSKSSNGTDKGAGEG